MNPKSSKVDAYIHTYIHTSLFDKAGYKWAIIRLMWTCYKNLPKLTFHKNSYPNGYDLRLVKIQLNIFPKKTKYQSF